MLSQDFRVRRKDFPKGRSRVFATTETASLQVFPGGDNPRATIVVSGKISKKAVQRNTIKRHIREEIKTILPSFPNGRYIFYAKKGSVKVNRKTLRGDIQTLFHIIRSKM